MAHQGMIQQLLHDNALALDPKPGQLGKSLHNQLWRTWESSLSCLGNHSQYTFIAYNIS